MKVKILASGSRGNVSLVICGNIKILIDIGLSCLRVQRHLEINHLTFKDIDALFITHSHSDHIKGLETLIKKTEIKVYIPKKMYHELNHIVPIERCVFIDDQFKVGQVEVELIHTSHDTDFSVGYIITDQGKSLVHVTDTGYINRKYLKKMKDKDIYVIESNHDEAMLMDGPYPRFLKERVISDRGHLSNKTTASYLKKLTTCNTKYVILAHLSEKNNNQTLAYQENYEAIKGKDIKLYIAKQDEETELIEV
ncbi:MAG: MBL fold metallo-hydrolase [Bacilli bacterium]|nr:MBL fold metallo-hydrolase [Bacilli bacterium]